MTMRHIDSGTIRDVLPIGELIEALRGAFARPDRYRLPDRHHHSIPGPRGSTATKLIMPAFEPGAWLGTKIATIFPSNSERGLPSVSSIYVLQRGDTGEPVATLDGAELTRLRTAAASALAADYLARADASVHLMIGAGALAEPLIRAHRSIRSVTTTFVWNRTRERADALVRGLSGDVEVVTDLTAATGTADIISCATLSHEPLVRGGAVGPGTHVDLVGAYTPDMRESDSDLIESASVFVDTRSGALTEAGDLLIPINEGRFSESGVRADLFELAGGHHPGRTDANEVTVFKSVGYALEDLVAARLVAEALNL